MSDIKYANQDIAEFFGNPIENFNHQFKELLTRCKKLINDLDKGKCWFLNPKVNFNSKAQQSVMSSYRQRYMKAVQITSNGEKVVLGPTYKVGYGGQ